MTEFERITQKAGGKRDERPGDYKEVYVIMPAHYGSMDR